MSASWSAHQGIYHVKAVFQRLRLRTKLAFMLVLAVLALSASIGAGASLMYQRMVRDRIGELSAVLDTVISLAKDLEAQVDAHSITREQALARIRDDIHRIRFDGGNYLSLTRMDGVVLAHGSTPALEGKASTARDSDGRSVADLARAALAGRDAGWVRYFFPRPGETVAKLKIAAVTRFAPWDSYFLAGAYVDDLDADYQQSLVRLGSIGGGILLVIMVVTWLVNRDITRSLGALRAAMARLAAGETCRRDPGCRAGR